MDEVITIIYIRSSDNLVDALTRGLLRELIKPTSARMRLKPFLISH